MTANPISRRRIFSTEWIVLSLLLVGLSALLDYNGSLWRWNQLLYDSQVKTWERPAPDDIVIVAIDSKSLDTLGRWPWSRQTHADLVSYLTNAGARAIILDILFAEPDLRDPEADRALAEAIKNSGRVYLPVIIERMEAGGRLVETLPLPPLANAAAAMGHVDIDLDQDGIARRVFLKEGIGEPYWYSLGVALLRNIDPDRYQDLPGIRNPVPKSGTGQNIVRDHHVLLPFAGPPGHFQRVSFIDVVAGKVATEIFRDKIVLIGATATGLGDYYPTPVSGHSRPMPGVEINANLIDSLRRGITIDAVSLQWRILVSALLLMFSLLLFPQLHPKFGLVTVIAAFLLVLALSAVLLHVFRIWFPPTSILIGLLLGYPLWSWRRLENAVRYFEQELKRLDAEPGGPSFYGESMDISQGLQFLRQVVDVERWRVLDRTGRVLSSDGKEPIRSAPPGDLKETSESGDDIWVSVPRESGLWQVGIRLNSSELAPKNAKELMLEFLQQFGSVPDEEHGGGYELVQMQIQKIRSAISSLRNIRGLLSDTLAQMVDGLLVVNLGGRVVMANASAARLFGVSSEAQLVEGDVDVLMKKFNVSSEIEWAEIYKRVLVDGEVERIEGGLPQGRDILIQISPMSVAQGRYHGLMFILSDISLLKETERKRARALRFLSHDLRSPISSVISLVRMQQGSGQYFTDEEAFERIEHYAHRALRLAEEFLRLVRAESVDETKFEEVDFVSIVHNAADEVYAEATSRQIQLVRRIALEEVWIMADSGLVERALTNLLVNAIHYSPAGSVVELTLEAENGVLNCCIKDYGKGIASGDLERIFEPFQRVVGGAEQEEGGVGLGLTFVKTVATRHHGSVTVESQMGKGSRFCFRVPYDSEVVNQGL